MVGDGGPLSATTRKPSARPCQLWIADLLLTIQLVSGVSLFSPLLYGDLIDNAMPDRDVARPDVVALGMTGLPMVNGAIGVWQRQPKAQIGEGIMCGLRQALYAHLQRMPEWGARPFSCDGPQRAHGIAGHASNGQGRLAQSCRSGIHT